MGDHTSITSDKYALYEAVIKRYIKKYPREWNAFLDVMKQNRANIDNDFGSFTGESAFRFAGSVPEQLDKMLKASCKVHKMEPDYLNKEFFKRFPVFMVAKKI